MEMWRLIGSAPDNWGRDPRFESSNYHSGKLWGERRRPPRGKKKVLHLYVIARVPPGNSWRHRPCHSPRADRQTPSAALAISRCLGPPQCSSPAARPSGLPPPGCCWREQQLLLMWPSATWTGPRWRWWGRGRIWREQQAVESAPGSHPWWWSEENNEKHFKAKLEV